MKLAQQIEAAGGDPFAVDDVLQATVWVSSAEDIAAIFEELTGSWDIEITKIENKMSENLTIYVKFAFCKGIMSQMQLRYGEPPAYESA